jgi:hypothetical protein
MVLSVEGLPPCSTPCQHQPQVADGHTKPSSDQQVNEICTRCSNVGGAPTRAIVRVISQSLGPNTVFYCTDQLRACPQATQGAHNRDLDVKQRIGQASLILLPHDSWHTARC